MWTDEISRILTEEGCLFYDVHGYETVDSTNEVCKRAFRDGAGEGFLAIADEQTAGKGRLGRRWASPSGEAVYVSFLLTPACSPKEAPALTLVMGLSVAETVRELFLLPAMIKWPNDVVIGGKKICGILTEAVTGPDSFLAAVIGTGINANNPGFEGDYAGWATSLRIELGHPVDRADLTAKVLAGFFRNYRLFCETGDLEKLKDRYNALLVSSGGPVRVEDPAGAYTAVSRGIDSGGGLIAEMPDGSQRIIRSGEVSVRGLYGYV